MSGSQLLKEFAVLCFFTALRHREKFTSRVLMYVRALAAQAGLAMLRLALWLDQHTPADQQFLIVTKNVVSLLCANNEGVHACDERVHDVS